MPQDDTTPPPTPALPPAEVERRAALFASLLDRYDPSDPSAEPWASEPDRWN